MHGEKIHKSPDHHMRSSSPGPVGSSSSSSGPSKLSVNSFNFKTWCPVSLELQEIARDVYERGMTSGLEDDRSWENNLGEGFDRLLMTGQETTADFVRPPDDADKLYMSVGNKDVIEVGHPEAPILMKNGDNHHHNQKYDPRNNGNPVIHFGPIGSGKSLVKDDVIRQDVASKFGIKAFDSEFDSVIESIFGNRKDKYLMIRGISDYKDGCRKKEWQPYAALAAAAFMKSIITSLPMISMDD